MSERLKYKYKKWFTVDEAAKYLSDKSGEDIGKADIFEYVMDRRLTLSVRLGSFQKAKLVKFYCRSSGSFDLIEIPRPRLSCRRVGDKVMQEENGDGPFSLFSLFSLFG